VPREHAIQRLETDAVGFATAVIEGIHAGICRGTQRWALVRIQTRFGMPEEHGDLCAFGAGHTAVCPYIEGAVCLLARSTVPLQAWKLPSPAHRAGTLWVRLGVRVL
jgi:hypothetical protein